jgi:hypothetical protein
MARRWVPAGRRGKLGVVLALLAVLAVAGGGWWLAVGGRPKLPQVIYVVYDPGPTASPSPTEAPTEEAPPSATDELSASASATATPAPLPPGATPSPKPDLLLDPLPALAPGCNEAFAVIAHASNNGRVATSRTTSIRLTDMYAGHAIYSAINWIPVLGPGEDIGIVWHLAIATGCNETHTLVVEADFDDLIAETDEGNNVRHASYLLAGKPDLRTYAITLNPAAPFCNEEFTASISISNTGTVASGSGLVRFVDTLDGAILYSPMVSFPVIPAGGHVTVHVHFNIAGHMLTGCALTHRITAYIDPDDEIDEVYETNNTWFKDYPLQRRL